MKKLIIILFIYTLYSNTCNSQDCIYAHEWADCRSSINDKYKIYVQPRNSEIDINDTLSYVVVFYGKRDYIISFCADLMYYPLNIRLLQYDTKKELYNNATDKYCVTFNIEFYNTQNLILEVSLLADKTGKERIKKKDKICIGLIMQYKNSQLKTR